MDSVAAPDHHVTKMSVKFPRTQGAAMSGVKWAESRKERQLVTTTSHVNLKKQNVGGQGGMVSYEDLLIAQYLDELRNSQRKRGSQTNDEENTKPSPYTQKLPHSDYTYKYRTSTRRRTNSASHLMASSKPKIDAKFIADPSLWDPATPRNDVDEGPEKYQLIITDRNLNSRPASAPVKRNKFKRPVSAASTMSRRPWSGRSATYLGGRRIKSQYKKQPQTIRVTAFKNGSREPFIRLAAPSMKILLEFCTDKLNLPFAARRVFLEDGIEVFTEKDIPPDCEVYISTGENYKDPYAITKRNIILSNGAKWTLEGLMLPAEGKKKVSRPRLSKRLKKLADHKRVRIIVYRNGKCTEPVEVVADLSNKEEFLVACTAKLDLRSHARLVYDWEGNEIDCLADTPILDECLQQGGTCVLGPIWVSTGEGFSPTGTKDFLITIREVIKSRLKESRTFRKELMFMMEGQKDMVQIAVKICSMTKEELEETLTYTDSDIAQLMETLKGLDEKLEALQGQIEQEESEGTNYRMRHIKTLPEDKMYKMVGAQGLKLKVNENGTINMPRDFYFNVRKAAQGSDNAQIRQRLLDELSGCFTNPQTPKLAPIAKKIFNQFGREITDVNTLKTDDEIWVSFGEAYISPFTYALQVSFDLAKGRDVFGEKKVILREQLGPDNIIEGMTEHENYEASVGFPMAVEYEPCKYESEREHVDSLASMAELDPRGSFLYFMGRGKTVLYPELVMNAKLPRGHKELWPSETQIWVFSKSGFIYCKPFPQLCLAVLEQHIETALVGKDIKMAGYVVALEKKMIGNPHQMWTFNPDATIASKAYPNLLLTYLNSKFGEQSEDVGQPEGVMPGNRVYMMLSEPLKKEKSYQRFAMKQESLHNLGQWKFNESSNPEWNKQALSWPVRADGSINKDFDWPMEGYILPNAPKLHKMSAGDDGFVGMIPLRLLVARNGERNMAMALPVVGPNLTNFMKDTSKKPQKQDKPRRRGNKQQEEIADDQMDNIEMDVNLHCRELTIRELEFTMFLDHCTSLLNLPFAGRRLYDENGNEHFTLKTLKRDQLVYVSCGEIWSDPNLSRLEQQRRLLLSQLMQDMAKMRQYAALRNPEKYVLEVDTTMIPNSPVIVNRQWSKEEELREQDNMSVVSGGNPAGSFADPNAADSPRDPDVRKSFHEQSHERSERRLENLKWPWERLVNVNNSYDADPEANKYTDREMYEKYKPKTATKLSRDTLQRFEFSDGFISLTSNRNLVLGVAEPEGRAAEVHLVKRRPDDIYQQWMMKENGEVRSRHSQYKVLTVSMPNNEPFAEDEEGRPLTFSCCKVTLQNRITNEFGKAHQRWRYDAELGFIHSFSADLPDKEITAANKADVCTFAIASNSKIDQPGYVAEVPAQVPVQGQSERAPMKQILVCMSCARAMRGRYKLHRLTTSTTFSCAMGNAKKLKLQQIGSFRVLNGKVDLSSHEYELTLQEWEDKVAKLMDETSAKTINKEINVARSVKTVKVLAYKNGEGRLRQGEIICGSSVEGILNQCTQRLGLNTAAARMYAEDGTLIVEMEDLVDWAVQNYRSMMADQLEKLFQDKTVDETTERGEGEGEENQDSGEEKENAETDQKEADKSSRQREYLLSQVRLPSQETILRYPIEIWVSSGKSFVPPEVVESKMENRKKKRAFRSAVSVELDIEKHCLRQMKGRRLDELNPGEYKGTKNSQKPVVVEGHWEELTPEEQEKHHTVHKLEEHLNEVKKNQKESTVPLIFNMEKKLYKQPETKRVLVYPNGESVERAAYIWGDSMTQLFDMATMRLNLWKPAKRIFTMEGKEKISFADIKKDELLCVSAGKPFKQIATSRLYVEVKANWSRAHKQYGPTSTDVHVEAPENPKVHVDPFGPPILALPVSNGDSSATKPTRPKSAKPVNA